MGWMGQRAESLGMSMQSASEVSGAAPNIWKTQEPPSPNPPTPHPHPICFSALALWPGTAGAERAAFQPVCEGNSSRSPSGSRQPGWVVGKADMSMGAQGGPGVSVDRCLSLSSVSGLQLCLCLAVCITVDCMCRRLHFSLQLGSLVGKCVLMCLPAYVCIHICIAHV